MLIRLEQTALIVLVSWRYFNRIVLLEAALAIKFTRSDVIFKSTHLTCGARTQYYWKSLVLQYLKYIFSMSHTHIFWQHIYGSYVDCLFAFFRS